MSNHLFPFPLSLPMSLSAFRKRHSVSEKRGKRAALAVAVLAACAGFASPAAADWPQFRGPLGSGAAQSGNPPTQWSAEQNVAWTVALPGKGFSQPVIADGHVYVTAASGPDNERLHLLCYDESTGKELWHRQIWATGSTMAHAENRIAMSSPVVIDGHVVALYSTNDLMCVDREGNLQWLRGLALENPNIRNSLGMGSSLTATDGIVCIQLETDDASFAFGIDVAAGTNRWKIDRPRKANWSSPVALVPGDGRDPAFLLQSATKVSAVAARTGETLWEFDKGGSSMSSMTPADGLILVPTDGVTAIIPPVANSQPEIAWNNKKLNCSYVSPVAYNGKIYTINSSGVLTQGDLKTGETDWQLRLGGSYWGTPTAVGGHLYCPAKDGTIKVVKLGGDKGEIVSENPLGQEIATPPSASGDALFFRTDTMLRKVARS